MINTKILTLFAIFMFGSFLRAKDAEISWTGDTSGIITYPADDFAAEEYKHNFSDVKFKYKNNETGESETVLIKKDLSQNILKEFLSSQKNILRRENFLKSDIGFLASINYIIADEDYEEIDGKISLHNKYDPIVIFKVPIEKFEQNYRVTFLNDIMVATNWETGQRRIKKFPLTEVPPSPATIQKVIPSVFSKSALKVLQ